ncbi:MAG: hypothetical protein LBD65_01065 [Spirochaetaceae bacterium]|jgi:hypothetical protein|nr:hypothetical protein [Spirochaetaceae bacterium]
MRQKILSVIAIICIAVYVVALGFAAYKIITGINDRQRLAEREFAELVEISSTAGTLGFTSESFKGAIQDALLNSKTLQAVIVSSPLGIDAFEREPGRIITWIGGSPRFKTVWGFSKEPFFSALGLDGIRNATISAVSSSLDPQGFINILKYTLMAVLTVLMIACFTLILESLLTKSGDPVNAGTEQERPAPKKETAAPPGVKAAPAAEALREEEQGPRGLYSPYGIGWEDYIKDRLSSELRRCTIDRQDLVFIIMEFRNPEKINEQLFNQFAAGAVNYFTNRDLIFEKGYRGISVIIPHTNLEQGLRKSEIFHNQILQSLFPDFQKTDLCIGLSSRLERIIEADRLIFETEKALKKALGDPVSPVVAFKSDPVKYRAFIASRNKKGL